LHFPRKLIFEEMILLTIVVFVDILRQCFVDVGWHIVQGRDAR